MIIHHELLTREQEQTLIKLIQSGDKDAEEALLFHNERLICKVALRYLENSAPDVGLDDLMQEGRMGVLRAAHKWSDSVAQEKHVHKFSTYASWWIYQFIRRYASRHRSGFSRSVELDDMAFSVYRVQSALLETLKREPTTNEIAIACKIPVAKIESILSTPSIIRLDYNLDQSMNHEQITDPKQDISDTVETCIAVSEYIERLEAARPRHARVIRMVYGLNDKNRCYSRAEIGRKMKITRERVRQLHDEAIKFMRE